MRLPDPIAGPRRPVIDLLCAGLSHFDGPVIVVGRCCPRLARTILETGISPLDLHILDPDAPDAEVARMKRTFAGIKLRRAGAAGLADLPVTGAQAVLMRFPLTRLAAPQIRDITHASLDRLAPGGNLILELRWLAPGLPGALLRDHDLRADPSPLVWRGTPTRVVQYSFAPTPYDGALP